ncbi:DUF7289 family protein [Haloarchaeobius sp. DYHT-AS-18]|uniref:DUF7289 family protein n=1 Tax=Haloarchaeobius sp. DYHT-AS-18 TaxID=3446117 RepID=UPI003EBFA598
MIRPTTSGGKPRGGRRTGSSPHTDRSQTAVVAMVLLIGLVTIGVVSILVVGGLTLEQQQSETETKRIEYAFLELGRTVDSVALSDDGSGQVDFALRTKEGAVHRKNTGRITVTANGTEIANQTFGSIEYRKDETVYAYQAGGVWRGTGDEAMMVAAPQFHYRDGTLNLPIPTVSGDDRLAGGKITLRKNGTRSPINRVGYVEGKLVTVEIQSEYYAGWAQYLRERTNDVAVSVDEANQTVVVKLGRPLIDGDFAQGVYATGGADGDVKVDANGNAGGITGPVKAEGDIDKKKNNSINGSEESNVNADLTEIDPAIDRMVESAKQNGSKPRPNPLTEELDEGKTYYVDSDIVSSGNDIEVDLADGNVTLIVNGSIALEDGGIEIHNASPGTAFRVYSTGHFGLKNGQAGLTGQAQYLQIYGTSDMQVGFTGGSTAFYGTIYAPRDDPALDPGETNVATIDTKSKCDGWDVCIATGNSAIEGAIVAGPTYVGSSTGLTHDPSLVSTEPSLQLEDGLFPPPITFLHVSVHDVKLDDDDDERIVLAPAAHRPPLQR